MNEGNLSTKFGAMIVFFFFLTRVALLKNGFVTFGVAQKFLNIITLIHAIPLPFSFVFIFSLLRNSYVLYWSYLDEIHPMNNKPEDLLQGKTLLVFTMLHVILR